MVTSGFRLFFLALLVHQISGQSSCPFRPQTWLKTGAPAEVVIQRDSKLCGEGVDALFGPGSRRPKCPPGLVDVHFAPAAFIPYGKNMWPHIDLNVTVVVNTYQKDIFVQLECLYSPNTSNKYCHDRDAIIAKWGKAVWPCRQHTVINSSDDVKLPFTFELVCFRMFGMSHYRIVVTLSSSACELDYVVTTPLDHHTDPRVIEFVEGGPTAKPNASHPWSPIIAVDTNEFNFVEVRIARIERSVKDDVTVAIYEVWEGRKTETRFVTKSVLAPGQTTLRTGLPAGEYYVFAYVDHPNCALDCGSNPACAICPHTHLNFTLSRNHLDRLQSAWLITKYALKIVAIVVTGFVVIGSILSASLFVYYRVWKPYKAMRRPAQAFEMRERPVVLLVYSNDSPEHVAVVEALATVLEASANATVLLDTRALVDPSLQPSLWLMNALSRAAYKVVVFSEGSAGLMDGRSMRPNRPFPDQFVTAVSSIVSNDLRSLHGRTRVVAVRFDYSPASCIPPVFVADDVFYLTLPAHVAQLFAKLHGVDMTSALSYQCDADLRVLHSAIGQRQRFVADHPGWLEARWESEEQTEVVPLPSASLGPEPVDEIAKKYPLLLAPEDDDQTARPSASAGAESGLPTTEAYSNNSEKFKLIGSLDDISMSSNEG